MSNAFLHEYLDKDVYISIRPGFSRKEEIHVCKLNKSVYGHKQVSRNWFANFSTTMQALGYLQCKVDYSLFRKITAQI